MISRLLLFALFASAAFSSGQEPRMVNLSTRAFVGSGSAALTIGFVIDGAGEKTVLVRGIGPALAGFGVTGTLPDPQLAVFNSDNTSVALALNDDWRSSDASAFAAAGAFGLTPGSKDAALVLRLTPGAYTAQIRGAANAEGVVLAEVYDLGNFVPAVETRSVLTAYEMFGNPVFGCTQGDLSDARATKYTFTVMTSGRLTRVGFFTQGARQNADWGDAHAKGTSGSYRVRLYRRTASGSVAGTSTNPGGDMTLVAQNREAWFPGKLVGGFQLPADGWPAATNQIVPASVAEYVGGAKIQSFTVRHSATRVATGEAPSGFLGTTRAFAAGVFTLDLYDMSGDPGLDVTQGEVLCISQENQDPSPTANYCHNNEAHSAAAPLPAYGLPTPLDPAIGVYFNAGNQDFRKAPFFSVEIDGTWYGQPFCFIDGINYRTDENPADNGGVRLVAGSRYARQILTPREGYSRVMRRLWLHGIRYTGKSGFTNPSSDGRLQVRVMRAPLGTNSWTQYWPAGGAWSTFPAGTFGSTASVDIGGGSGSGKVPVSDVRPHGMFALDPALAISAEYHYAVEARADPATPDAAFILVGVYNPHTIYHKDMPAGGGEVNYPVLLPAGRSGRTYNRAETSDDAGATWEPFVNDIRMFPVAFEPTPL